MLLYSSLSSWKLIEYKLDQFPNAFFLKTKLPILLFSKIFVLFWILLFFVCISFKRYIFWYNGSKNESLKNRTYSFQRVTASTRETKVMVAVSHAKLIDEVFSVSRKKTSLAYTVQRSFIAVRSDNRLVKDLSMVSTWNFPELISFTITRILLMT